MPDLDAARRAVLAAQRAKAILEDPLVAGALAAIKAGMHADWESSEPDDRDGREDAFRMLRAVKVFEQRLQQHTRDGAVAEAEIENKNAAARRAAERGED